MHSSRKICEVDATFEDKLINTNYIRMFDVGFRLVAIVAARPFAYHLDKRKTEKTEKLSFPHQNVINRINVSALNQLNQVKMIL